MSDNVSLNKSGLGVYDQALVNRAAFCVTTGLALGTMGSLSAAMSSPFVATQVAYGILCVGCVGASAGSIAAWIDPKSVNLREYFENLHHHAGVAIAGMFQLAAQTMVQSVVQGASQGISTKIRRAIGGPDFDVDLRQVLRKAPW